MEYQFKIQIKGITKPPVWRIVIVPANFTFRKFHTVIQLAFGWEGSHLFELKDRDYQPDIRIGDSSDCGFGFYEEVSDANKIKLSEIFYDYRKFFYIYDFGDSWLHEITLEAELNDNWKEAVCISGKGACPPEDCGGPSVYQYIKNLFQTKPDGKEAKEYRMWLGLKNNETLDVNTFDIDAANRYLKQI